MTKALASFTITGAGDEYVLHLEDEDGDTFEYSASFEQLDLISEAIEQQLDSDEEDALEVETEE
jgi:hypothetical protein